MSREVVVVAYGRSPMAKAIKGSLVNIHPVEYGAQVLTAVLNKVPELKWDQIDDIVFGCGKPEKLLGENIARMVALRAGVPCTVPALQINRFCSSGLQAITTAANEILAGQADITVAGGIEVMNRESTGFPMEYHNAWLEENTDIYISMGLTAENVAKEYNVTREDEDAFAFRSQKRAAAARAAGRFDEEIVPIQSKNFEGEDIVCAKDECIRESTTLEGLAGLKPVFSADGLVTAGNSSQLSDGCAVVVLMSAEKAAELGVKPIAKFVSFAVTGVEPNMMGIGPIYAIPKALERAGLKKEDMDVIELNEAFASQSIAVIRTLGLDEEKVNPNGGAIAMGHPLGATGAMLTCKLLGELKRRNGKYGMVTMCIGGGQGAAGIFELL